MEAKPALLNKHLQTTMKGGNKRLKVSNQTERAHTHTHTHTHTLARTHAHTHARMHAHASTHTHTHTHTRGRGRGGGNPHKTLRVNAIDGRDPLLLSL